jgi:hypothetical protein
MTCSTARARANSESSVATDPRDLGLDCQMFQILNAPHDFVAGRCIQLVDYNSSCGCISAIAKLWHCGRSRVRR